MRMLNNYICNDVEYSEFSRNCQTFAADFYGLLVNDESVVPYAALNRVGYKPSRELFMYDYEPEEEVEEEQKSLGKMFVSSMKKKKKQRKSKKDETNWGDHWEIGS